MESKYIFLALSICIYNICNSQLVIPKNCKELLESPANGKKMNQIIYDIDNDGKNDNATIVEHNSDFSKFYVLIYLSSINDQYEIELLHNEDFAIFPYQLEINKGVLEFGYSEDNSALGRFFKLRYNNNNKKIQLIGFDSSIRFAQGICKKSYNLITGKYNVTINTLNNAKKKVITKTGIETSKELYVDNLNIEEIEKLDKVGKKFEPK